MRVSSLIIGLALILIMTVAFSISPTLAIGARDADSCFANAKSVVDLNQASPIGMGRWLWAAYNNEILQDYPATQIDRGKSESPTFYQMISNNTDFAISLNAKYRYGVSGTGFNGTTGRSGDLYYPYSYYWDGKNVGSFVRCVLLGQTLNDAYNYLRFELGFDQDFTVSIINGIYSAQSFMTTVYYNPFTLDPAIYGPHPFVYTFPELIFTLLPDGHVHFDINNPSGDFLGTAKIPWGVSSGGQVMLIVPSAVVDELAQKDKTLSGGYPCDYSKYQLTDGNGDDRPRRTTIFTVPFSCKLYSLQTFFNIFQVFNEAAAVSTDHGQTTTWQKFTMGTWPYFQDAYQFLMTALKAYSTKTGIDYTHITRAALDSRLPNGVSDRIIQPGYPSAMDEWFIMLGNKTACPLQTGLCTLDGKIMAQSFSDRLLKYLKVTGAFYGETGSYYQNYFRNFLKNYEPASEIAKIPTSQPSWSYRDYARKTTNQRTLMLTPKPASSITPVALKIQPESPANIANTTRQISQTQTQTVRTVTVTASTTIVQTEALNQTRPQTPSTTPTSTKITDGTGVVQMSFGSSSPNSFLLELVSIVPINAFVAIILNRHKKMKLQQMPMKGTFTVQQMRSARFEDLLN
jgi:hypothetical protein